ncbi:hypothetical protein PGTUg99_034160 [Puccinia graminis f. sp. tritici]|uniref:Uncharacterized protein n=2 Tax=Puccinia graminis f. sp. tritici TaxID=56615 RepID=E3JZG8_PUCGT|nr:uncharacterized protein PGTG_03399 [Puccinia graminis f. sp. tritici CRL 75-36-700-3]EFP77443.2 hypothetical protein PGTG_03399 [Puccinia graminis f. sp. tritici CRL 75-36-700-3]KAA1124495.1 hypothetical protein PGTUg99_034160 [Puccinia graminis f. sp. tritici]
MPGWAPGEKNVRITRPSSMAHSNRICVVYRHWRHGLPRQASPDFFNTLCGAGSVACKHRACREDPLDVASPTISRARWSKQGASAVAGHGLSQRQCRLYLFSKLIATAQSLSQT